MYAVLMSILLKEQNFQLDEVLLRVKSSTSVHSWYSEAYSTD